MNRDRLWVIAGAAAIVVVVALGWVLGISPVMTSVSADQAQVASITQSNAEGQTKLVSLQKQFKNISALRASLSKLRSSIPSGGELSVFLAEIDALCNDTSVSLTSVTVDNASLYVAPVVAAAPTTTTNGTAPTPTPAPATTSGTTGTTGTVAPTGSGLILIPVVVTVSGSFANVMAFENGIQNGERLFLVSGFQIDPSSPSFTGVMTGNIYSLAGLTTVKVAKPKAPVANPTPTPTGIPTNTATPDPTNTAIPGSTPTP